MVTTAAPFGPAQPAFTTPLAHTTAFASETKATLKTIAETNNKAFIGTLPCFGRVCAAGPASQPHERNRSMYRRMLAVEGRKGGPRGVMLHGPNGDSYLCCNNADAGTVKCLLRER